MDMALISPSQMFLFYTLLYFLKDAASTRCFWCTGVGSDRSCEWNPRDVTSGPGQVDCWTNFCVTTKVIEAGSGRVSSFARNCDSISHGNVCLDDGTWVTCYQSCSSHLCNHGNPDPSHLPVIDLTRPSYLGVAVQGGVTASRREASSRDRVIGEQDRTGAENRVLSSVGMCKNADHHPKVYVGLLAITRSVIHSKKGYFPVAHVQRRNSNVASGVGLSDSVVGGYGNDKLKYKNRLESKGGNIPAIRALNAQNKKGTTIIKRPFAFAEKINGDKILENKVIHFLKLWNRNITKTPFVKANSKHIILQNMGTGIRVHENIKFEGNTAVDTSNRTMNGDSLDLKVDGLKEYSKRKNILEQINRSFQTRSKLRNPGKIMQNNMVYQNNSLSAEIRGVIPVSKTQFEHSLQTLDSVGERNHTTLRYNGYHVNNRDETRGVIETFDNFKESNKGQDRGKDTRSGTQTVYRDQKRGVIGTSDNFKESKNTQESGKNTRNEIQAVFRDQKRNGIKKLNNFRERKNGQKRGKGIRKKTQLIKQSNRNLESPKSETVSKMDNPEAPRNVTNNRQVPQYLNSLFLQNSSNLAGSFLTTRPTNHANSFVQNREAFIYMNGPLKLEDSVTKSLPSIIHKNSTIAFIDFTKKENFPQINIGNTFPDLANNVGTTALKKTPQMSHLNAVAGVSLKDILRLPSNMHSYYHTSDDSVALPAKSSSEMVNLLETPKPTIVFKSDAKSLFNDPNNKRFNTSDALQRLKPLRMKTNNRRSKGFSLQRENLLKKRRSKDSIPLSDTYNTPYSITTQSNPRENFKGQSNSASRTLTTLTQDLFNKLNHLSQAQSTDTLAKTKASFTATNSSKKYNTMDLRNNDRYQMFYNSKSDDLENQQEKVKLRKIPGAFSRGAPKGVNKAGVKFQHLGNRTQLCFNNFTKPVSSKVKPKIYSKSKEYRSKSVAYPIAPKSYANDLKTGCEEDNAGARISSNNFRLFETLRDPGSRGVSLRRLSPFTMGTTLRNITGVPAVDQNKPFISKVSEPNRIAKRHDKSEAKTFNLYPGSVSFLVPTSNQNDNLLKETVLGSRNGDSKNVKVSVPEERNSHTFQTKDKAAIFSQMTPRVSTYSLLNHETQPSIPTTSFAHKHRAKVTFAKIKRKQPRNLPNQVLKQGQNAYHREHFNEMNSITNTFDDKEENKKGNPTHTRKKGTRRLSITHPSELTIQTSSDNHSRAVNGNAYKKHLKGNRIHTRTNGIRHLSITHPPKLAKHTSNDNLSPHINENVRKKHKKGNRTDTRTKGIRQLSITHFLELAKHSSNGNHSLKENGNDRGKAKTQNISTPTEQPMIHVYNQTGLSTDSSKSPDKLLTDSAEAATKSDLDMDRSRSRSRSTTEGLSKRRWGHMIQGPTIYMTERSRSEKKKKTNPTASKPATSSRSSFPHLVTPTTTQRGVLKHFYHLINSSTTTNHYTTERNSLAERNIIHLRRNKWLIRRTKWFTPNITNEAVRTRGNNQVEFLLWLVAIQVQILKILLLQDDGVD